MSEQAYEELKNRLGGEVPETIADLPLTPADKEVVLNDAHHGIAAPAEIMEYLTLDEFKKRQNNFYTHFTLEEPGSGSPNIKKASRHFQRFEILYPELTRKLLYSISQTKPVTEEQWQDLYDAYQKMSKLVDRQDPGYASYKRETEQESQEADWYLCA